MTLPTDEADLIEARRLRDLARALVRTDLATLRSDLAARPIGERIRQRAVEAVTDSAQGAATLARENPTVVVLTLAALAAWFSREPLATFTRYGWYKAKRWFSVRLGSAASRLRRH